DDDPRLFVQHNDTHMLANETRLWQPLGDRFGWIAGVSYTHNRTRLTRTLGPHDAQGAVTGVTNVIDEFTVYGEASLRLTEGFVATGGGRFTHSRLSGHGEDVDQLLASAMAEVAASRSEDAFLPSASLAATVMPETTLYLRCQEGFRPGGLAVAGSCVTRSRNGRIATFGFGGRHGQAGRGPFDLAASLAYTRWQDIQADFSDSAGFPSTANIGDGRIWTATMNGSVAVTPSLRLDAGLTWNDGEIDEPPAFLLMRVAQVVDIPGFTGRIEDLPVALREQITRIPNVARFSGRVGFDYHRPLRGDLELTAQGWANYIGRSRLGVG